MEYPTDLTQSPHPQLDSVRGILQTLGRKLRPMYLHSCVSEIADWKTNTEIITLTTCLARPSTLRVTALQGHPAKVAQHAPQPTAIVSQAFRSSGWAMYLVWNVTR
eukprot:scaffold364_cov401-Prasinococcus_capsulatus_cf.AAC.11